MKHPITSAQSHKYKQPTEILLRYLNPRIEDLLIVTNFMKSNCPSNFNKHGMKTLVSLRTIVTILVDKVDKSLLSRLLICTMDNSYQHFTDS